MIKHALTSIVPDGNEDDKVQPSDWNAAHIIEVVTVDPGSPFPGDLWMLGSGVTPNRRLDLKFCDVDGITVTLFTVVR